MRDTLVQKGKRKKLCEHLQAKGIQDKAILQAIEKVPRHLFMARGFEEHAYQDKAFPIAAGQTISQPYTVAFQTQLLDIKPKDKVLEVGTGSGYQTAILVSLNAQVYTIERQLQLYKATRLFLPKLGYRPKKIMFADGYQGYQDQAPYDKIIVTAGAPNIPINLLKQLKINGKMVIPLGEENQEMTLLVKISDKEVEKTKHGIFRFVPMLENKN